MVQFIDDKTDKFIHWFIWLGAVVINIQYELLTERIEINAFDVQAFDKSCMSFMQKCLMA